MNVKCAENFHIRMGVAGTYNAYDFCTHFKMDILNKPQQKKLQHCYLPALRNAKYQHYQYVGTLRAGRKTRRRMFLHSIASGEKIVAPMWNKAARICARKNNTGAFKDQSIFCPSTVTVLRRAYEKLDYNRAVALCAKNNGKLLGTRAHTDRCAKRFIKKGKKQTAAWIYSSKWADAKRVYDLSTYPKDDNTHLITICEYPIKCTVHKIQNGEREEATLSYNQTARYTCWTGYEMDGIANPICNNSGRLTSIPTCRPFKCIAPRVPKAAVFPAEVLYLEAVHYECDTGWLLIGDPKPTCTASRNFSSVPTCSIVKCLVPSILNGWSEEKEVNYQKPVIYKCNPGYTLVYGTIPPHCNAYGNLNSTGNITCERDHGFNRSQPCSNTRTILQISKQKYNFFSADALCRKHNGWLLNRKTLTSSCASTLLQDDVEVWLSGTIKGISRARPTNQGHDWDFKLKHVVCEMLPCGPPPSITNGAWRNTTRLHQVQEVMYACDDGYSMQGKGHLVCQVDRQWSPNPPTCEVKCSAQLPADFLRQNQTLTTRAGSSKCGQTAADIIIVCDESASMRPERKEKLNALVARLDESLKEHGIGLYPEIPNQYSLVGFGHQRTNQQEPAPHVLVNTANQRVYDIDGFRQASSNLQNDGSHEDGYYAIQFTLNNITDPQSKEQLLRLGKAHIAPIIIFISDEDRDVHKQGGGELSRSSVKRMIRTSGAQLQVIVDNTFEHQGRDGFGVDATGKLYTAQSSGAYTTSYPDSVKKYLKTHYRKTLLHYTSVALELGGAAWNLNAILRSDQPNPSYVEAFVSSTVTMVEQKVHKCCTCRCVQADPDRVLRCDVAAADDECKKTANNVFLK
ncbi:uncharacterized protein LOC135824928 [Sycon ciliatum]|uniref:uncharacterized protein LOC135824928 n=1 Tax=Sycon ciliatum TaxID=27933 RepID=UPI0031F67E4D